MTTAVLMDELPELGTVGSNSIAKLAGVTPLAGQAGTKDGKPSIRGGRSNVRTALNMPTILAMIYIRLSHAPRATLTQREATHSCRHWLHAQAADDPESAP